MKDALASPRLHNKMRAHAPFPAARLAALLAFAFAMMPATLLARTVNRTENKPQKKKHIVTQHGASHPNAHPEAQSKKRDAEAKKRLAKDRKQQKKTEKAAKGHPVHPVAERSRSGRPTTAKAAVRGAGPKRSNAARPGEVAKADAPAKADAATETRVHAWLSAQKHASPQSGSQLPATARTAADANDPHAATSANSLKAAAATGSPSAGADTKSNANVNADSDGKAKGESKGNATGTSNPPPDNPEPDKPEPDKASALRSDTVRPVSVVSVVRRSPGVRPQMPPVEEVVAEPVILPTLYNKRGRLVVPPPLKGSHEILIRQNQVADDEGLDRIQNDDDLDRLRAAELLIAIPTNAMLHVDERLPANRRYCRPWTALFLDTLTRQHYARFQTPLQLTSAVRTVEFQQQLIHRNGNAAPAEGDTASPHLTGQAIDIGKKGLTMAEIAWLRGYLLPLVQQGKVDVEEEFQQSCFHISVYKKYLPRAGAGRRSIAASHGSGIDVLATGLR